MSLDACSQIAAPSSASPERASTAPSVRSTTMRLSTSDEFSAIERANWQSRRPSAKSPARLRIEPSRTSAFGGGSSPKRSAVASADSRNSSIGEVGYAASLG